MKILVISKCATHPVDEGNKKMILSYCDLLSKMGHELHFLYIKTRPFRKNIRKDYICSFEDTRNYWGKRLHVFRINYFQNFWNSALPHIRRITSGYWNVDDEYPLGLTTYVNKLQCKYNFDACLVNYVFLSKVLDGINIPKCAIFTHDHFTFKNLVTGIPKCLQSLKPNEEARGLQRAQHIFAMQDEEAVLFKALSPRSEIYVNYCNFDYVEQPIVCNYNILFLSGGNEYNLNGFKWFLDNIFPIIIDGIPSLRLIIGGSICKMLRIWNLPEQIKLYGYVNNLSAFFLQGDVAINPTYQGTGLKIKTFESISYDKVTVVHPHSTNGIYHKYEAPVFAFSEPQDWLAFFKKVLGNQTIIGEIKERNRKYIKNLNKFVQSEYARFLNS